MAKAYPTRARLPNPKLLGSDVLGVQHSLRGRAGSLEYTTRVVSLARGERDEPACKRQSNAAQVAGQVTK